MKKLILGLLFLCGVAYGQPQPVSQGNVKYDSVGNLYPQSVNGHPMNLPAGTLAGGLPIGSGGGGMGNVQGPMSATIGQVALFNNTFGTLLKADTDSGLLKLSSGVASVAVASDLNTLINSTVAPVFANVTSKPTTLAGYGITNGQPLDADLTAIAALSGTNTIYYRSAANTWTAVTIDPSTMTFTGGVLASLGSGGGITHIVQDTSPQLGGNLDQNGHHITGLVIGTDVQAFNANLTTYAGITPSSNVQSILRAANYGAIETLMALVPGTNIQIENSNLDYLATVPLALGVKNFLTSGTVAAEQSALSLVPGTNVEAHTAALTIYAGITPSANMQTFLGSASFGAMRSNLGLVIGPAAGATVQAYSANLDYLSTFAPSTDIKSLLNAANFTSLRSLMSLGSMALQANTGTSILIQKGNGTGGFTPTTTDDIFTFTEPGYDFLPMHQTSLHTWTTTQLDYDGTLAANSSTRVPSQQATKTYADAKVDDTAYNATTWDADTTHAPSKNAVRDKIETIMTGGSLTGPVTITGAVGSDALTVTGGTQTVSEPALSVSQTWNASGVAFTTFLVNGTSTASAAGTLLMDLQQAGTSKFKVDKSGNVTAGGSLTGIGSLIAFNSGSGNGLLQLKGHTSGSFMLQAVDAAGNTTWKAPPAPVVDGVWMDIAGDGVLTEVAMAPFTPVTLYAKSFAPTMSTNTDIATIAVPPWITRFRMQGAGTSSGSFLLSETTNGASGTYTIFDATGGGGNALSSAAIAGPTTANTGVVMVSSTALSTSSVIVLRQIAGVASVGTLSCMW